LNKSDVALDRIGSEAVGDAGYVKENNQELLNLWQK
jgi:hypothetical protein